MKLSLTVSGTLDGPVSVGTVSLIQVVRSYFGLGLVEAKMLIDRAVFGGETVEISVPEGVDIASMIQEIELIETPGDVAVVVHS